jgi:lipoyl-dependent peroxiredoxin
MGRAPTHIDTRAVVSLESQEGGFSITHIHLDTQARVPGIGEDQFRVIAEKAKVGCPLSKVLNAEITLEATLADDL